MNTTTTNTPTQQAATSHQCSRDADGNGEGGRNGYPSDSVKAALTREKYYVAEPEDHDRTRVEEFDSGEAPDPTSDGEDSDEEEVDSSDGEGVGATAVNGPRVWNSLPASIRDPSLSLTVFRNSLKTHLFVQ